LKFICAQRLVERAAAQAARSTFWIT
jgi:hypothetical protein